MCELTVKEASATTLLKPDTQVSLQTNGQRLRVWNWQTKQIAVELTAPEIQFHTNDFATTLTVTGFLPTPNGWTHVSIDLE